MPPSSSRRHPRDTQSPGRTETAEQRGRRDNFRLRWTARYGHGVRVRLPSGFDHDSTFWANEAGVGVGFQGQQGLERNCHGPISDGGDRNDNPSVRTRGSELPLGIIGPTGFASPSWVDLVVGLIPARLHDEH